MDRLKTEICGVEFKNPIIAASGTFGYGLEFKRFTDITKIGGISIKGISLHETEGNPMPRIAETYSGMLNAIGLQNVGVEKFLKEKIPALKSLDTRLIVNFWGKTLEEYVEVAKILDEVEQVDMLEMNISCPNIKEGGISFSSSPEAVSQVVSACRKVIKNKPLIVKLSPNVQDIKPFAKACEESGADAISAINTLIGMAIDVERMKPVLANMTGGLSGPAIKPIALRMVKEVYETVKIPVIGIGGIGNWKDAAEFILAGASAIQIGTANFVNANVCNETASGLDEYLERKNINHFSEIIGKAVR